MKKQVLLMLLTVMTALAFSACGAEGANPGQGGSTSPASGTAVTVTDMAGEVISLPAPAATVVALNPGDCEIVYALGAGDTLVGRGEYCDYPEAVQALPQLKSGNEINVEELVAMKPDLVLVSPVYQNQDQIDALKKAGLTLAVSQANTIAQVYDSIVMIGALLGRDTEAAALVTEMQDTFSAITVSGEGAAQTVYFEVSPLEWGLWTGGSGTFMDEICQMLGLTNAFADIEGWAEISQEQVLERDPDYIVTVTMYFGEGPQPDEEIMSRPGWENLKAVANQRIYCADNDSITRPGPRLKDAAQDLHDFVYGK